MGPTWAYALDMRARSCRYCVILCVFLVRFAMKMTIHPGCLCHACRFSLFGHETRDHGRLREYTILYIIYDNKHHDFASSRLRVNKKVGGTRRRDGGTAGCDHWGTALTRSREGAKGGDSSMRSLLNKHQDFAPSRESESRGHARGWCSSMRLLGESSHAKARRVGARR